MEQIGPHLRLGDLTEVDRMLKEMRDIPPIVMFRKLHGIKHIQVWTYSDASSNIVAGRSTGRRQLLLRFRYVI